VPFFNAGPRNLENQYFFTFSSITKKVDPSVAKEEYQILQSFDFEGRYQKSGGQQGILCFDFFLVGVLTIE
jgi:hypothetical protein